MIFPANLTVNVEAGATGNGGTLILNTGSLSLIDGGQIQNITFSSEMLVLLKLRQIR